LSPINAKAIPNITRPETRRLEREYTHATAIRAKVAASTEYAGAVPAIPIMSDSAVPRESLRSDGDINNKNMNKKTPPKRQWMQFRK